MESTNPVVMVNGVEVDLSNALPLLLEDWLALEKVGVTISTLSSASVTIMYELAKYVVHKADPNVDLNGILKLKMSQLTAIFRVVGEVEQAGVSNRPSTTSSTS